MDWNERARPWLEAAPDLETAFAEIFDTLFAAADLKPGERVLDIGFGTGPTLLRASNAVGQGGQVLGVDIAPPLVAAAAERVSDNVELVVGDAGTHGFETGAFDAIIANFGIMFFEDNVAAFKNLRSAVQKGGRLTATVWATPPDNPWFSIPRRVVDANVSDVPRPDPAGPGPMRFGDPTTLEGYLKETGWAPTIETVDLHLVPPGGASRVASVPLMITVGMLLAGMDVSETTLGQIRSDLTQAFAAYDIDGEMRVPARIHVVSATAV